MVSKHGQHILDIAVKSLISVAYPTILVMLLQAGKGDDP